MTATATTFLVVSAYKNLDEQRFWSGTKWVVDPSDAQVFKWVVDPSDAQVFKSWRSARSACRKAPDRYAHHRVYGSVDSVIWLPTEVVQNYGLESERLASL
jgi:hypothetical protein